MKFAARISTWKSLLLLAAVGMVTAGCNSSSQEPEPAPKPAPKTGPQTNHDPVLNVVPAATNYSSTGVGTASLGMLKKLKLVPQPGTEHGGFAKVKVTGTTFDFNLSFTDGVADTVTIQWEVVPTSGGQPVTDQTVGLWALITQYQTPDGQNVYQNSYQPAPANSPLPAQGPISVSQNGTASDWLFVATVINPTVTGQLEAVITPQSTGKPVTVIPNPPIPYPIVPPAAAKK